MSQRSSLAEMVKAYLSQQGTPKSVHALDASRFQILDPAAVMVADGLRAVLNDADLKELIVNETNPEKLRLFLLADCFLQYHSSQQVRQEFLSRVKSGSSLEEAVKFAKIADFVAATVSHVRVPELVQRLQSEGTISEAAAKISSYLFVDYYLTLRKQSDASSDASDPALSMLREGKDIREIARYVAQRTAIQELASNLGSQLVVERLRADPQEGFKALVFLDYYLSQLKEPAAIEAVLELSRKNPAIDELALYASVTFITQKLLTQLSQNDVVKSLAKPSLDNLKTLLIIDYFTTLTRRQDIRNILLRGAQNSQSLEKIVEIAALALGGQLSEKRVNSLINEAVIPALKEELRKEVRGSKECIAEEERQRQKLEHERRLSHHRFTSTLINAASAAAAGIVISGAIAGFTILGLWYNKVYMPRQVAEDKVVNPPYEAVAAPQNQQLADKLSLEYKLTSLFVNPDYARSQFLGRLTNLKKQGGNANQEEVGALTYVLSQDPVFVGKEQLKYFQVERFQAYTRFMETLKDKQASLEEAEAANLEKAPVDVSLRKVLEKAPLDVTPRKVYLTEMLKEALSLHDKRSPDEQAALLSQLQPAIEDIAAQQTILINLETTVNAIQAQIVRYGRAQYLEDTLLEQKTQLYRSYNTSLEAMTRSLQTILTAITSKEQTNP